STNHGSISASTTCPVEVFGVESKRKEKERSDRPSYLLKVMLRDFKHRLQPINSLCPLDLVYDLKRNKSRVEAGVSKPKYSSN
ncbi:hypothetical protein KI387_010194, partial [Taxus chinensis]